jgi:hypothetical protein
MKVEQMNTTKEGCKAYLETAAVGLKQPWHSQLAHKLAVGIWALDCLKIEDQEQRDEFLKQWGATPSSFGTNASALGQALGRESGKTKLEKTFAGF